MIHYAESSAVLAWLLDEGAAKRVLAVLTTSERVVASDLTLIECERVLLRAVALGELDEGDAADRRTQLAQVARQWHVLRIGPEVVARARQPFPAEPLRTLDALHLATALLAREAIADLRVLSLDDRIRRSATLLGFPVDPAR